MISTKAYRINERIGTSKSQRGLSDIALLLCAKYLEATKVFCKYSLFHKVLWRCALEYRSYCAKPQIPFVSIYFMLSPYLPIPWLPYPHRQSQVNAPCNMCGRQSCLQLSAGRAPSTLSPTWSDHTCY